MVRRALDKVFRSVKTVTDLKNITKTKTPRSMHCFGDNIEGGAR